MPLWIDIALIIAALYIYENPESMAKLKQMKKNLGISPERLTELRRKTLIESTGSSVRLSSSKVTNEQVEQVLDAVSKPSERKKVPRINEGFGTLASTFV